MWWLWKQVEDQCKEKIMKCIVVAVVVRLMVAPMVVLPLVIARDSTIVAQPRPGGAKSHLPGVENAGHGPVTSFSLRGG